MRRSLLGLVLALLTACSQAPIAPTPARAAGAAAAAPSTRTAPPPVAQTTPPTPVVQSPAPASPPLQQVPVDKNHPLVKIETSLGDMVVQLDADRAPLTVKNFLTYVKEHYYDGSGFYRVVHGFVIQGGDFTSDLSYLKPKHPPIPNESGNGFNNQRGAIGMGTEENDPHSAQAAFYINVVDNSRRLGPRPDRWGYAVFGQVVTGLDVMDKIAAVQTHDAVPKGGKPDDAFHDVPVDPVTIIKITLLPSPAAGKP